MFQSLCHRLNTSINQCNLFESIGLSDDVIITKREEQSQTNDNAATNITIAAAATADAKAAGDDCDGDDVVCDLSFDIEQMAVGSLSRRDLERLALHSLEMLRIASINNNNSTAKESSSSAPPTRPTYEDLLGSRWGNVMSSRTNSASLAQFETFQHSIDAAQQLRGAPATATTSQNNAKLRLRRNGEERLIAFPDIIPGDLLLMSPGTFVPYDVTILGAKTAVDEISISALPIHGVPHPIRRSTKVESVLSTTSLSVLSHMDTNVVPCGSTVLSGETIAVVNENPTASISALLTLAESVASAEAPEAPLATYLDAVEALAGSPNLSFFRREACHTVRTADVVLIDREAIATSATHQGVARVTVAGEDYDVSTIPNSLAEAQHSQTSATPSSGTLPAPLLISAFSAPFNAARAIRYDRVAEVSKFITLSAVALDSLSRHPTHDVVRAYCTGPAVASHVTTTAQQYQLLCPARFFDTLGITCSIHKMAPTSAPPGYHTPVTLLVVGPVAAVWRVSQTVMTTKGVVHKNSSVKPNFPTASDDTATCALAVLEYTYRNAHEEPKEVDLAVFLSQAADICFLGYWTTAGAGTTSQPHVESNETDICRGLLSIKALDARRRVPILIGTSGAVDTMDVLGALTPESREKINVVDGSLKRNLTGTSLFGGDVSPSNSRYSLVVVHSISAEHRLALVDSLLDNPNKVEQVEVERRLCVVYVGAVLCSLPAMKRCHAAMLCGHLLRELECAFPDFMLLNQQQQRGNVILSPLRIMYESSAGALLTPCTHSLIEMLRR
eukprot:PhM_4_TR19100/c0_g1_i1/m.28071